ncbi:MAG: glycerol-3-phosphate 1-O-acyltransferase PlsY [Vampirovibrionales bacterium]|jgi:glycerol-3-phosphate acyltransferase PlsY
MIERFLEHTPMPLIWGGSLLLGYLMGAIPMGYLVAKLFYNKDITQEGSGNTGGTNVMRLCGKNAGLAVYALDFIKAALPVLLLRYLLPQESWLHVLIGIIAIVGHSKSVFLGFKGGKSAMSSLGVIFALSPYSALVLGVLAVTLILSTRVVSIASLTAAFLATPVMYLFGSPKPYLSFTVAACILVFLRHRDNIKRLMAGTENKI